MIPAWAIRLWPHALAALIVLAGVAWIYHAGAVEAERKAYTRQIADELVARKRQRETEQRLVSAIGALDAGLGEKLAMIRALRDRDMKTIQKGIADDPRYRAPECAVSGGVFDALSRAIGASDPAPDGRDGVTVPLPAEDP